MGGLDARSAVAAPPKRLATSFVRWTAAAVSQPSAGTHDKPLVAGVIDKIASDNVSKNAHDLGYRTQSIPLPAAPRRLRGHDRRQPHGTRRAAVCVACSRYD